MNAQSTARRLWPMWVQKCRPKACSISWWAFPPKTFFRDARTNHSVATSYELTHMHSKHFRFTPAICRTIVYKSTDRCCWGSLMPSVSSEHFEAPLESQTQSIISFTHYTDLTTAYRCVSLYDAVVAPSACPTISILFWYAARADQHGT